MRAALALILLVGSQAWTLHASAMASAASAQSKVMRSEPAAEAVVDRPVRTVRIWFAEEVNAAASKLTVKAPDGSELAVEGLHTMGEQDLMGRVTGRMPDGAYALQFEASLATGPTKGSIPFTVRRGGSAASPASEFELPLDIGVVIYDGTEPLDLFGPLEMWMNAGPERIKVHLIAEEKRPIVITTVGYPAELAPKVEPHYSFEDAPELDVLMVPGGIGTLREVDNPKFLEFLAKRGAEASLVTSVCTGSALLAKAGLLEGEKATGNKMFFSYITDHGPDTEWVEEARWVESGKAFTSSGVSAGIDMSLAVIERYFGKAGARMIAQMTEYEWTEDADNDPFTKNLNLAMPGLAAMEQRAKQGTEEP